MITRLCRPRVEPATSAYKMPMLIVTPSKLIVTFGEILIIILSFIDAFDTFMNASHDQWFFNNFMANRSLTLLLQIIFLRHRTIRRKIDIIKIFGLALIFVVALVSVKPCLTFADNDGIKDIVAKGHKRVTYKTIAYF